MYYMAMGYLMMRWFLVPLPQWVTESPDSARYLPVLICLKARTLPAFTGFTTSTTCKWCLSAPKSNAIVIYLVRSTNLGRVLNRESKKVY